MVKEVKALFGLLVLRLKPNGPQRAARARSGLLSTTILPRRTMSERNRCKLPYMWYYKYGCLVNNAKMFCE